MVLNYSYIKNDPITIFIGSKNKYILIFYKVNRFLEKKLKNLYIKSYNKLVVPYGMNI